MLVATNAEKLAAVEADLKAINPEVQLLSVATNIGDEASVANLFATVKAKFGHADVLVHNAGVATGNGPILEQEVDDWWYNFVRAPTPPSPTYTFPHAHQGRTHHRTNH